MTERPVDRVAAVGIAGLVASLGALIWKGRDGLDSAAYRKLNDTLYRIYRLRYGDVEVIAAAVVWQALHEFMAPRCRRCQGTREVIEGKLRAVCPSCFVGGESTGIHRYSDTERAAAMKISYGQTKRAAFKIRYMVDLLSAQDRKLEIVASRQLER